MSDQVMKGRVVTVSDRAFAGSSQDRSGPLAVALLGDYDVAVTGPVVVPDEIDQIASAVRDAVDDGIDVIVLTGGTGIGPRDVTPEALMPLLDKELPGIGEAIRSASRANVATADLSRLVAGVRGSSFIIAVPGSTGGVRDALGVAGPLIAHAVQVLHGADHPVHGN